VNRILSIYLLILCIFAPLNLLAEHDCIDEREYGHQVTVEKNLPKNWLTIGGILINDSRLHNILRTKYAKNYTTGKDHEGFTIDHFCGFKNGIYLVISNGDFGPSAEFSKETPKCFPCKHVKEEMPYFISGTGLKIGQDKKTASSILRYEIDNDITSISFEEIETGKTHNIWHSQTLRIEFRDNKLLRFSIYDSRENYN